MSRTTSPLRVEYILLGLLRQGHLHAYAVYQRLRAHPALGPLWPLKQSNAYAILARLEQAGYLTATLEPQGSRTPRRLLALTPTGEAAFADWLGQPVDGAEDSRLELVAKLCFAHEEGVAQARLFLSQQRTQIEAQLAALDAEARLLDAQSPAALTLRLRTSQLVALLAWLDSYETFLLTPAAA